MTADAVRRWLLGGTIGCLTLIGGCDKPVGILPTNSRPGVYIVLSREPWGRDSALYGLIISGSDAGQVRYGVIDRIEMTRRRDGAKFGWQIMERVGPIATGAASLDEEANVRLPWTGNPTGLGRSSLSAGDTYDLVVETEGQQLSGSAELPPALALELSDSGGRINAKWSPAPMGKWFLLTIASDMPGKVLTPDSSYLVKANLPKDEWGPSPLLSVTTVDTAYVRFLADSSRVSVGIVGGFGVFTGVSRASKPLPF